MIADSVSHGANRIRAGRGFPGEHDRVRPFVHGVRRIADLGARRAADSSRIDSSTCVATITGRPSARARADDLLLHARHLLERHLEPEIAARDHHAIGDVEDRRRGSRPPRAARSWR